MAPVKEELSVVDKFTNVFNRFIDYAKNVVDTSDAVEASTQTLANSFSAGASASVEFSGAVNDSLNTMTDAANATDYWTDKLGTYNAQALEAIYTTQELVDMGYKHAEALQAEYLASEEYAQALEAQRLAEEALAQETERANGILNEATLAQESVNDVTYAAIDPLSQYQNQLTAVERKLVQQRTRLSAAVTEYNRLAEASGSASEEAMKQLSVVEKLTSGVTELTTQHEDLVQTLSDLQQNDPAKIFDDQNRAANSLASDGLTKVLNKLTAIIAAYISLKKFKDIFESSLTQDTYELRVEARLGEGSGQAFSNWVRGLAREFGELTEDVYAVTNRFLQTTTDPANLEGLNRLTSMFAAFSDADFSSVGRSINQALRTGQLRQLSEQTGITTNVLRYYGVEDAVKSGDVDAFVDSLYRAAEAIGITSEAYEQVLGGAQRQWERFKNSIVNGSVQAGRAFINAFEEAFEKLNEFTQSDQGQTLFAALTTGFEVLGNVASAAVDILLEFGNFVADNFTTIVNAAAVALAVFGGFLLFSAISAALAALPILLIVGLLVAFILLLEEAGATSEQIFGAIAGFAGLLYATIYNIGANLWNAIAAFAEFFANVWVDPLGAVVRLFTELFDTILGIVETVAAAIDFVLGTSLAQGVSSFRNNISGWVDENFGESLITIPRLEEKNLADTVNQWAEVGESIGRSLDEFNPENLFGGLDQLDLSGYGGGNIDVGTVGNVKNVGNVSLADEDLKQLLDLAERDRQIVINMENSVPNNTININSGNADLTPEQLLDTIERILEEESASETVLVYDY